MSDRDRLHEAFDEAYDLRSAPGLRGRAIAYAGQGGRPRRTPGWAYAVGLALAVLAVGVLVGPRLLERAAPVPAGRGTPSPVPTASAPAPPGPSPQLFRAAFAANGPQFVLFGSATPADAQAQTWVFEGTAWRRVTGDQPPARTNAAMAYDGHQLILFGGQGACPASGAGPCPTLGDTWAFDGAAWHELHPAHSPAPVVGSLMTWAPGLGRAVLVLESGRGMETWTWDGSDWSQPVAPVRDGPTEFGAAMAYDDASGHVVLYGQLVRVGQPAPAAATWVFDGKTWTAAGGAPGVRQFPSMATGRQLYLFGGADENGRATNDLWEWTGSDWRQVHPAHNPPPRQEAEMGGKAGQLILYGGASSETQTNLATLADTWAFDGTDWRQVAG